MRHLCRKIGHLLYNNADIVKKFVDWSALRTPRVLVMVLLASLSGPAHSDPRDGADPVRILTYEVRSMQWVDREGAVARLRDLAQLDPDHPNVYRLAIELHLARRDWDLARELINELGGGVGRDFGEAWLAVYRGQLDSALEQFEAVLRQYENLEHLEGRAQSLLSMAKVLRAKKEPERAEELTATARDLYQGAGGLHGVAMSDRILGKIARDRGDVDGALRYQREAVAYADRVDDPFERARGWHEIGRSLQKANRLTAAIEAFERALEQRRELVDLMGQFDVLLRLGSTQWTAQRFDDSLDTFREALETGVRMEAPPRQARAHQELGLRLQQLQRPEEAVAHLRKALQVRTPQKTELKIRETLGTTLAVIGRYGEAGQVLRLALELARETRSDLSEARILVALAQLHARARELDRAIPLLQAALERLPDAPADKRTRTLVNAVRLIVFNEFGVLSFRVGDLGQAARHFETAIAIARQDDLARDEARAISNLGIVLAEQGRFEDALRHQQAAFEIWSSKSDPDAAWAEAVMAQTQWELGLKSHALKTIAEASEKVEEQGLPEVVAEVRTLHADMLYRAGRLEQALGEYRRAVDLSVHAGLPRHEWVARHAMSVALDDAGRLADALDETARALDLVERLRFRIATSELRTRFLVGKSDLFDHGISLSQRSGDQGAAFHIAERSRARSLIDLLAESRAALRKAVDPDLIEREIAAVDDVSAAALRVANASTDAIRDRSREELAEAEERLQRLKIEMAHSAAAYSQVAYPAPVDLRGVQQQVLAPGEILLSYHLGAEQALLWVVERERVRTVTLAAPEEIHRLVERLTNAIGRPHAALGARAAGTAEADRLGAMLIPESLPLGARLVIAPDGVLHDLPFDALRRGGRYLVEDHDFLVVPSATALMFMRDAKIEQSASGFLGVGGPIAPGASAGSDLVFSRQALERIGNMFPEGDRELLSGDEATKTALTALDLTRFRYLHFATHGWLDPENPQHFGLRLSDGMLYLDEIFPLDLDAEVVVLAACESGQGELVQGEGLISVVRAFLYAGARSAIVSLWPVSDRSTAEFMERFYGEIRKGKTVSQALRQTKLAFIASDRPAQRQPFSWAPFVLIGDPGQNQVNRAAVRATP